MRKAESNAGRGRNEYETGKISSHALLIERHRNRSRGDAYNPAVQVAILPWLDDTI